MPSRSSRQAEAEPEAPQARIPVGYRESASHVAEPTDQFGYYDTSGTSSRHHDLRTLSPVFTEARLAELDLARRALDPNDPTAEHHVTLPQGATIAHADPEAAKERVLDRAQAAADFVAARDASRAEAPTVADNASDEADVSSDDSSSADSTSSRGA